MAIDRNVSQLPARSGRHVHDYPTLPLRRASGGVYVGLSNINDAGTIAGALHRRELD